MATRFATVSAWRSDSTVYPIYDYLVVIPDNFTGTSGVFPFKISDGRTPANRLPYAPNSASFNVIFHTDTPSTGGITGPGSTTSGNLVIWTSATGTTVGDGPAVTDFATAAQGTLADTAVQPGDDATVLGSGAQPSGQTLESDGAGGTTWGAPAAGGITELTGPITAGPGSGSQATTVTPNAIDNTMLALMPADTFKGNNAALPSDPSDLTADQASTVLDSATDPFVRTSALPPGGGDVSGPGLSVVGNIPTWSDLTGTTIDGGLATSTGGNGVADNGRVAIYGPQGQLRASATSGGNYAVRATGALGAIAGKFEAAGGTGIEVTSSTGMGASIITSGDAMGLQVQNDSSTTEPTLDVTNVGTADIAHFEGPTGGLHLLTDGGAQWTSGSGAQTTATNLPAFGALTKGVVPAAGAVPAATNFLTETGVFAVPAGTGVPTSRTISTTAPLGGGGDLSADRTFTIAQATSVIDGFLAAADWVIFNAKQAAISFGTGVLTALGVNVGTAGSVVINGGALGTPSSGTATNLTGTAAALNIGGNAATVTTNANLTGPVTSVGNATTIADAELAAIAALTSAADKGIQFTGAGTAATYDLSFGTEAAYTGTPTWTAGAAPSGASNLRQFWERNGNRVAWTILLTYATNGTTVTNLSLTFPTEFPTPVIPAGFTGADVRIWTCDNARFMATPTSTGVTFVSTFFISRNAADNGFVIAPTAAFTSSTVRQITLSGFYFTA